MAFQPFSGSHLIALMAIKGFGPVLGAIYTFLILRSEYNTFHSENLYFTLFTDLSVGIPTDTQPPSHSPDKGRL
jgi:hypothetical protein